MADEAERELVEISFRCSDAAYERLFRRAPQRERYRGADRRSDPEAAAADVLEEVRRGDRFGVVLARFLKAAERASSVTIAKSLPAGPLKVRKLWIDAEIKTRFDALADEIPLSRDTLVREAIYRFTSKS